jgi:hypothetical protein
MKRYLPLVLAALLAVALLDTSTQADDDSLSVLERLDRETARLTKAADGAVAYARTVHGWQKGVLVGSDPLLVAGYSPELNGSEVQFQLADGTRGSAQRIDGDADLGVAVYRLPAGAAVPGAGLEVEAAWPQRGRLLVLGGRQPGLAAVTRSDPSSGRVRASGTAGAALALSTSGRLLGLRPAIALGQDCKACHVVNDPVVGNSMPLFRSTFRLQPGEITWSIPHVELGPVSAATLDAFRSEWHATSGHPHHPALKVPRHPPAEGEPKGEDFIAGPVIARVVQDIEAHGRIRRAYFGAVPADAKQGAVPRGVVLSTVIQDSPVARAGLKKGDVITAVNGVPTASALTLTQAIVLARPGDVLRLQVAGAEREVRVELGDRRVAASQILRPRQLGFVGQSLDESLRAYLGLDADAIGVVVTTVGGKSAAHAAGLRRGDVIVAGRDGPIRDLGELEAELAGASGEIALKIVRGKTEHLLVLTLEGAASNPR